MRGWVILALCLFIIQILVAKLILGLGWSVIGWSYLTVFGTLFLLGFFMGGARDQRVAAAWLTAIYSAPLCIPLLSLAYRAARL